MQLNVALIRMVFSDRDAVGGLGDALQQAHSQGAELAVLPEIQLAKSARMTRRSRPPAGVIER